MTTLSNKSLRNVALAALPAAMVAGMAVSLVAPGAASAAASSPTQTALSSSADPSSGGSVTFTATVTSGATSVGASGTVTFTDVTDGTTLCDTVSLVSSGTATCVATSLSSAGTYAIAAAYSGTSTYLASSASITQLVQSGIPTQLSLSSSDADVDCELGECPAEDVTYTATVTAASGQPSGDVTFTDGGAAAACTSGSDVVALASGAATCTVDYDDSSGLDDAIVAALTPAAGELASSAEIYEVIGLDQAESSTLALTTSANPVSTNTSVTYSAAVTGELNGTPSGDVTFTDGGAPASCSSGSDVVALDSSAVATCTISAGYASAGTEAIEALYGGSGVSGGYNDSYEAFDEAVTASTSTVPTATTLSPSADPSPAGDVTYDVAVAAPSGTPTGSVTVSDGTNSCVASLTSGAGSCILDETSATTLTVTASYPATDDFAASTASISELVTAPTTTTTTTTVGESAASAPYGDEEAVSFSVTVAPSDGATGPSGDVVTIDVGTASCPATLDEGYGSCSIGASALAVGGPYAVSATFGGDADFSGSSSTNTVEFSVTAATSGLAPQSITFTSRPPNHAVVGGSYAVTATGGASGNPVTFSSATPSVCSVSGSTVSFVGVGICTIDANQAGNAEYAAAPTAAQSFFVGGAFRCDYRHLRHHDWHLFSWCWNDDWQY